MMDHHRSRRLRCFTWTLVILTIILLKRMTRFKLSTTSSTSRQNTITYNIAAVTTPRLGGSHGAIAIHDNQNVSPSLLLAHDHARHHVTVMTTSTTTTSSSSSRPRPQNTSITTTTTTTTSQYQPTFPSNQSTIDALFDSLPSKGCMDQQLVKNSTWIEHAFQLARFVNNETELFRMDSENNNNNNNNSTSGGQHFFSLPWFDHESHLDHVRGGVAMFQNAFVQGDRPPMLFDCHFVYVPGSCKQQEAQKESFDMAQLIKNTSSSSKKNNNNNTIIKMDSVVMIYQFWGESFYHSMIEVLPRLGYVLDYLKAHPDTAILAPQALVQQRHDLNRILGLKPTQIWIPYKPIIQQQNVFYFAKRLLVPTGTRCGFAQPKCVERIQQAVMSSSSTTTTAVVAAAAANPVDLTVKEQNRNHHHEDTNKFLLVLQKRNSRRLLNHAALLQAMRQTFASCCIVKEFFGYESLMETMALHSSAHVVVGPHGAGFANLLWTKPGHGMVELHPQYGNYNGRGINVCHLRTAKAAGLEAMQVIQKDGSSFGDFTSDIPATLDAIQTVLDKVIQNLAAYNTTTTTTTTNDNNTVS